MKRLLILFSLLPILVHAQLVNPDLWIKRREWGFWDFERANTARLSFYMGRSQKRAILLMNLARQDGDKFTDQFIKPYVQNHLDIKSYDVQISSKNACMLRPSITLWLSALSHAVPSGIFGYAGHQAMNLRMTLFGNFFFPNGENCSYGHFQAMKIVLQLLHSPPHRRNILNKDFSRVAVSKFFHLRYLWTSVTTFGGPKLYDYLLKDMYKNSSWNANASISLNPHHFFWHFSIGKKYTNSSNSGSWSLGSDFIKSSNRVLIIPNLQWMNHILFFGMGGSVSYSSYMNKNVIFRPVVSAMFPFTVKFSRRNGSYFSFFDLEKSNSSIMIKYGFNIGIKTSQIFPFGRNVVQLEYSKNFGFKKKSKRLN